MYKIKREWRLAPIASLILSIVIALSAGFIGSLFTTPSISTWYATLIKPTLNPPAWIFGPVWTALFILMGIAAFLVWRQGLKQQKVRAALCVYGFQLVLNVFWSILFFGLQRPDLAFIEIIALWLAIAWTISSFYKVSRAGAYLLVPYILWVSFAIYLNYTIWQLNAS